MVLPKRRFRRRTIPRRRRRFMKKRRVMSIRRPNFDGAYKMTADINIPAIANAIPVGELPNPLYP